MENIIVVLTRQYGQIGVWLVVAGIVCAVVNYILMAFLCNNPWVVIIEVPKMYLKLFIIMFLCTMGLFLTAAAEDMTGFLEYSFLEIVRLMFFFTLWFYLIEVAITGPILWAIKPLINYCKERFTIYENGDDWMYEDMDDEYDDDDDWLDEEWLDE